MSAVLIKWDKRMLESIRCFHRHILLRFTFKRVKEILWFLKDYSDCIHGLLTNEEGDLGETV